MTGRVALDQLVVDLEEGRVDLERTRKLASAVSPEAAHRKELGKLVSDATDAYGAAREHVQEQLRRLSSLREQFSR